MAEPIIPEEPEIRTRMKDCLPLEQWVYPMSFEFRLFPAQMRVKHLQQLSQTAICLGVQFIRAAPIVSNYS
jgi:hypothetical protein